MGSGTGSSNNFILVTGSGSTYVNSGDWIFGGGGSNTLVVADGGRVISPNLRTYGAPNNLIVITNEGYARTVGISLGESSSAATGNRLIVTGAGSVLTNIGAGQSLRVGLAAGSATLRVENGGRIDNTADVTVGGYFGLTAPSNKGIVTGAGSQLNIGGSFYFGWGGASGVPTAYNELLIADGGQLNLAGPAYFAYSEANSNTVTITGAGSAVIHTASDFMPNRTGTGNDLIITNGGMVRSANGRMGNAGDSDGLVKVTGNGSVWTNVGVVRIGESASASNNTLIVENDATVYGTTLEAGTTSTGNKILVTSGGKVQFNTLTAGVGADNSISNIGGVYEFRTATPTVTPNGAGRISITDGTISYAGVANANVYNANVANIAFAGDNTFQLNSSSNTSITSYTFDSVANTGTATNYQRLALTGTGSRWQSTTLNIGSGGELYVGDASATIAAAVTLNGDVLVQDSFITFTGPVTVNANYVSDPSTNTFDDDLTVGVDGALMGGAGDLFDFKKSLLINSTNNTVFDLTMSTVSFSGGTIGLPINHTNAVTGGDFGANSAYFGWAGTYRRLGACGRTSEHMMLSDSIGPNAWYYIGLDHRHQATGIVPGQLTREPNSVANVLYEDGHAGVEKYSEIHFWDGSSWGPKYSMFFWCLPTP